MGVLGSDGLAVPQTLTKATGFTLDATYQGLRVVVTAPLTIIVPAVGVLGNKFEVEVVNDSGGEVVLNGPGATNVTLANGDVACIIEANSKQRVVVGPSTVIS